ncbi:MAG TPA: protein kinase [Vicinamibacterales bacterium]|nr:protein kinase [Vicinamibacterales bacterium]
MIGQRIGSYEVVGKLGAGGMGEVYRARDTRLDRDVAIKVLPESFALDADRVARFRREAKTLASLSHPNIAAIYGIEESGETRALVMELVDGEDLSRIIARGPMAAGDVLPIARQIADALEAAHDQGIVHRDLKPANIKVKSDGTVKVLDFGLAKAADPATSGGELANSPTLTARATQMGMIVGTAAYMSPEQAKGRTVDKRADIWAFGVVLYEMLTGQRGYEAEDVSDTLAAVLLREVDWSKVPATAPPRLVALLHDCLVRDPKQRLRDMGEARRIIEQMITGTASGATTAPAPVVTMAPRTPLWRRAMLWTIGALVLVAAAAAAWRATTVVAPQPAPVTRSRVAFKEVTGLVAISRDGTKLVYTRAGGPQGFHLELRDMDQFEGRPIPGSDGGISAVFSPAGDWVAYSGTDNRIKKIPATGGTAITLTEGSFFDGATWGDDDTIVYVGSTGLVRMPASGGAPTPLTTVDKSKGEVRHIRPQFLPGERQLLFTVNYASADPQFAILDLTRGTYKTVARSGDNGQYAASGHLLSVRGGTLFAQAFDLARAATTGSEAPVIEGISVVGPSSGTADYAVSADGVLVYSESASLGGTLLTWRDRKGEDTPLAGQVPRAWGTGSLSPDGRRVANGITADRGTDMWVVDLSRGNPTRLTFGGNNDNPVWMPDGRTLIYGGTKDNRVGLYKLPVDGSAPPTLVFEGAGMAPTSVSPDGKTLMFGVATASGKGQLMVLPLEGGGGAPTPRPLRESTGSDTDGHFSPDGHWVAFVSNESGRGEVYVVPYPGPGPKVQVSDHGGSRPRWSATGRELLFWDSNGGSAGLYSVPVQLSPFSAGTPVHLFSMFAGTTWGVAPDAQHFLIESVAEGASLATVTNWFDELRRRAPVKK